MDPLDGPKYNALQTIAAHSKYLNALFCPIVKVLKERLLACLKPNVLLFMDLSPIEFAKALSLKFPPELAAHYRAVKVDMSKYDKSQNETHLLFELEFMRRFGVDACLVDLWEQAHRVTDLVSLSSKFKIALPFQRKSGDAMTLLGNTIVNMAVCASAFANADVVFSVFVGDDSLLWGSEFRTDDLTHYFGKLFNLSAKILQYRWHYFCSKFLVPYNGMWAFVPDPLKMLTKMGRHDVRDEIHLEEYCVGIADLLLPWDSVALHCVVAAALRERYALNFDPLFMIQCISRVVLDKKEFSSLFYFPPDAVVNRDPSRPRLD